MRRSANTWVIKALLVFIALTFVIWGVGDYVNQEGQMPVAEGKGWSIHPREFSVAYDNEFNRLKNRFGGVLDKKTAEMLGLKQRALQALIHRHLLESASQRLRLTVAPERLRQTIASNPAFLVGERFDPERYRQLLRNNRMTPKEFESQLTEEMLTGQIRHVTTTVVALPDLLLQDVYRLENEKRVVEMLRLKFKPLEADIPVTDAQLTTFLQKHSERFMHPAQVKVEYVLLDGNSVKQAVTLSPTEIKEYYEENSGDFHREERRQISHILAQVTDDQSEKSALERLQQARERLNKGEPFARVAQALSDDVSKAQGGALGEFTRETIDHALEGAAFSLPVGQVSEPIKSEFGYHLLLVTAVQAAENRTLEQVTPEIKERLVERKAQELVYERSSLLDERVAASGNLQSVAQAMQLPYRQTDFFSRDDHKGAAEVEQDDKFLDTAFATPAGETSALVEIKESAFVVLRVLERREPTLKSLEESRESVTNLFKTEQAHQQAGEWMAKALKMLQDGKSWEEAARLHPAMRREVSEPFVRGGGKETPPPAVRQAVFKLDLANPLHPGVLEGLEELLVVRLQKIEAVDGQTMAAGVQKLRPALEESVGQEQLAAFLRGLWQEGRVEVHQAVLEKL
ncbi:MAG: SurA N-terminal domain-containing protein [Magnetococcales bacterium]|nr:SurA N-terminal domain-containing protein [Magnetococcales bacterium]